MKPYIPRATIPTTTCRSPVPGFGLIVALFLITLIGFLTANFVGRSIVSYGEHLLGPHAVGARHLQRAEADFRDGAVEQERHVPQGRPRRISAQGRLVDRLHRQRKETEINAKLDKDGDPIVAVFMPCTPNPTTGFLMYVYRSEIVMLDMTIEDGAKLIVSAGLVAPEYKRKVVTTDGKPLEVGLANPTVEKVSNLKFK